MGWIADFFRLAWGFLYWNTRKSVYRLRRSRGVCPCHHPSDSGRAWETACAAVVPWDKPERFRRLCPLLRRNNAGAWRCSVDRSGVRPFWGRAAAAYASALLVAYLFAGLAAFVALRSVGYGVTYPGVVWPPAWKKFTSIRTGFFLQKYQAAVARADMKSALMSLSTAYNLDPRNYTAGLQLAKLWQVNQPGLSDQIYRRLIAEHPAQSEPTAQLWFRALLARGDFAMIETLATLRIQADPARSSAWLNAFLFANRRTADAASRRRLAASPSLAPTAGFLLGLVDAVSSAPPAGVRDLLLAAAAEAPDALSFYHVCGQLIIRGFAQDALQWLDRRSGLLGLRDLIPLRLDALARLGWHTTLRSEVEGLLVAAPAPSIIELLSAHLIRHPDAALRGLVFARLERTPLPATDASYPAYLSLFCAAGAGRDAPRLHWTAARIKEVLGGDFRGLESIGQSLLDGNRTRRVENYLPALQPLPLEVSYALFEHYSPAS